MKTKKFYFGVPQKARSNILTRFLYKTFLGLISVLLLIALAVYFLVDPNDYKRQIERLVQEQTGLELELNGRLEFSLLTTVGLTADDVKIAYQSNPIADIKQLFLNIELIPFAYQTLSVSSAHLDINYLRINKKYLDKFQLKEPPDSKGKKPQTAPASFKDYFSPAFLAQYIPRIKHIEINDVNIEADKIQLFQKIDKPLVKTQQLKLKISHLPLYKEQQWIAHKPAALINSRSEVQINTDSLNINQHHIDNLSLGLNNRHGTFSVKTLELDYQLNHSDETQLDFDLKGHFSGNLSGPGSSWGVINQLQLSDLEIESSRFKLQQADQSVLFSNNKLNIKESSVNKPFNQARQSFRQWFLDSMVIGRIYSSQINLEQGRFNNLNLQLDNQHGQLNLKLDKLSGIYHDDGALFGRTTDINLNLDATTKVQIAQPSANINSKAALVIQEMQLNSHELLVNVSDQDIYRLHPTQIRVYDYSLLDYQLSSFWQDGKINALSGNLSFYSKGLSINGTGPKNIQLQLTGQNNSIDIQQLDFQLAKSDFQFTAQADLNKQPFQWQLRGGSTKLNLQPMLETLGQKSFLDGLIQFSVDIQGTGVSKEIESSTDLLGDISFKGKNIRLNNLDLDKLINHFEDSQGVGLLDVGAYALAGPAGVIVVKGNDYHNLSQVALDSQGQSTIQAINLDLNIKQGFLSFNDAALYTEQHMLAASGSVDLIQDRYHDLKLATIDNVGCVIYQERVSGPLNNPEIIGVNRVVKTIVNPFKSVFKSTQEAFDITCDDPFYQGKLAFSAQQSPQQNRLLSPFTKLGSLLNTPLPSPKLPRSPVQKAQDNNAHQVVPEQKEL